jgi:hypothetical protein
MMMLSVDGLDDGHDDDVHSNAQMDTATLVSCHAQLTFHWVLQVLQLLVHSGQQPAWLVGQLQVCCGWLVGLLVLALDPQHSSYTRISACQSNLMHASCCRGMVCVPLPFLLRWTTIGPAVVVFRTTAGINQAELD